jgi:hypothetical protein
MIPAALDVAAQKVWKATLAGQGISMYPWLESLLKDGNVREEEWVPSLEIGSAIYCLHGRFAEGERLARRAVARSLKMGRGHLLYLRSLLALARAHHCQSRTDEVEELWREVGTHFNSQLGAWGAAHAQLFQGEELGGNPVPVGPDWLADATTLAQPDPFPLWQGNLFYCRGPVQELPLWQPVPYPTPLDHLASWPRLRGVEREPLLSRVKEWRQSRLSARWLGTVGDARHAFSLELELECPGREPMWISVEVAGSGYEVYRAGERNVNLLLLCKGLPVDLPAQPEAAWRVLFRGSSHPVQRGTRALVRVGFGEGPPVQTRIPA